MGNTRKYIMNVSQREKKALDEFYRSKERQKNAKLSLLFHFN